MIRVTAILVASWLLLAAPAAFAMEGDYNGDGVVDDADKAILLEAVGTSSGDPGFVAAADHDGDGVISLRDVAAFLELSK